MTKEEIRKAVDSAIGDVVVREVLGHRRNIMKPEALVGIITHKYGPEKQVQYIKALSWLIFDTFAIQEDPYSMFKLISATPATKLKAILLVEKSLIPA